MKIIKTYSEYRQRLRANWLLGDKIVKAEEKHGGFSPEAKPLLKAYNDEKHYLIAFERQNRI